MRKIKLLVVDDSMLFREVLSRYIREDTEIDVVGTAGDAYSARDMILKFEPDVMTLDIEMPKMDGVAFLKKLLPQYYLPVIVVSSSIEQKQSALDSGAVGFIQKPSARTTAEMQGFAQNIARAVKSAFAKNGGTKPETTVTHTPLSSTGKKFHKADTVARFRGIHRRDRGSGKGDTRTSGGFTGNARGSAHARRIHEDVLRKAQPKLQDGSQGGRGRRQTPQGTCDNRGRGASPQALP